VMYQPNDPQADTTGGQAGMWHLNQIMAREAWDLQRNDSTVVIGVVDTGVHYDHPDLIETLKHNLDDPIDGIDNDNDGYVDNWRGWDLSGNTFGGPGDNVAGPGGHGTGVTGAFAAEADNGRSAAGVCFNCSYLPIKASPDDLIGLITNGYQGIVYAVDQGCQIVNCSWGSGVRSKFGEDVIEYATTINDVAVIAACGNSMLDETFFPASFEKVISVANSSYTDTLCCNSTYNYSVDVSAPGHEIIGPLNSGGNLAWSGTSSASPVAAGAVALTLSYFPQLTPYQAAQRVRVTTDDIYDVNPDKISKLGSGRVNLFRALTDPASPSIRLENRFSLNNLNGENINAAGDTAVLTGDFINYLDPTNNLNIRVEIPAEHAVYAEMLNSDLPVGQLGTLQSIQSQQTFQMAFASNMPLDYKLDIRLVYEDASQSYLDEEYIQILLNPSWINVAQNDFHTTINSRGNFGFEDFLTNQSGLGADYQNSGNALFEGGFLIGNSVLAVSDRIRNENNNSRDNDFRVVNPVRESNTPFLADFEASTVFDDGFASLPYGLSITQNTYAWNGDDFVLFQYIVQNDQALPQSGFYAGLFADWDMIGTGFVNQNACDFDLSDRFVYAWDKSGSNPNYYGMSLLSPGFFHAFANTNPSAFVFDNQGKFQALSNTTNAANGSAGISGPGEDIMHFISAGPFDLPANGADTLVFAILGGTDLTDFRQNHDEAAEAYRCYLKAEGPVAPFAVSALQVMPGANLQFTDNNANATSWSWDFGDGTQSTQQNPDHVFSSLGSYEVSLTVEGNGCVFTSSQTIVVTNTVSIAPEVAKDIRLYPNPTSGLIQLELGEKAQTDLTIQVFDLMGRTVSEEVDMRAGEGEKELDLGGLIPGWYILTVSGPESVRSFRIRKN
ncbi:MAG: S8 family serine peptidase, partial [Bacteroidota bacterium]